MKRMMFWLSEDMVSKLDEYKKRKGGTKSATIRAAIDLFFENEKRRDSGFRVPIKTKSEARLRFSPEREE